MPRIAVVMITRNRRPETLSTLRRLTALEEAAEIVVVDNASDDGTAHAVAATFPRVRVIQCQENLGAAGRTVGVSATDVPLVAFADDDSWWAPGSLTRAAEVFSEYRELGLLHARVLVEPGGIEDEICANLAGGPERSWLPGPSIVGHLACGVVVRRDAYLEVGGYSELLGFGGEERLLSLDLAVAGWGQCYLSDVVVHHQPSDQRVAWPHRWARTRRNDTLTAVLRLPAGRAVREVTQFAREVVADPVVRRELPAFAAALARALRRRRRVPDRVWREVIAAERRGHEHPARQPAQS